MSSLSISVHRCLLALVCLLFSSISLAGQNQSFAIGVSQWGILDSEKLTSVVLSYELADLEHYFNIRPSLVLMSSEESHHYFAMGAVKYFNINDNFELGVGFSAGYLNKSKELGSSLEFYSRLIAKYRIQPNHLLRMEFGHVSNAGISNTNPGSENLVLAYEYRY